jgi:hypothetical protein
MMIARGCSWPYRSGQATNRLGSPYFSHPSVLKIYLQLGALSDALTPALRAIKQSEFYPEPKFHVSIGWALLERNGTARSTEDFPAIAEFPQDVIEDLNRDFASQLRRPSASVEAEEVCVKIGKEAFQWGLGRGD